MALATVDYDGAQLTVQCPGFDAERARAIPQRKFNNKTRTWHAPVTAANVTYIMSRYDREELTDRAAQVLRKQAQQEDERRQARFPSWFRFKNEPMAHQTEALNKSWGHESFAFLMEMRTGKTFVVINWAAALAMNGDIDTLIVVCPTPIKAVWIDELEKHCPIDYYWHIHEPGQNQATEQVAAARYDRLKVMIFGVEAMSQGSGHTLLHRAALRNKCMMALDESSRIKNHKSKRTERVIEAGESANYRTIMTGTLTTQGIEDIYSQYRFLDEAIVGMKSYYVFQARYCVMGGFEGRKIVGYDNVKELMERIAPYSYQCSTRDVIDPPEEIAETRYVQPTKEQLRLLNELGDPLKMRTQQGDNELEVETILERLTRYQQIVGGHFPYETDDSVYEVEPVEGRNPKLDELVQVIEDLGPDHKVLIWARFRPEIHAITDALTRAHGDGSVAEYHGGNRDVRDSEKRRFQTDPDCRFFVSNQSAGGMGLELSAADTHIYYSNSFSYEDRKQSRFRTDSSEQKAKNILVVDLIMDHKTDHMIVSAIQNKTDVANYVRAELQSLSN
jgi:SNF2 family DNA or RNA helicase